MIVTIGGDLTRLCADDPRQWDIDRLGDETPAEHRNRVRAAAMLCLECPALEACRRWAATEQGRADAEEMVTAGQVPRPRRERKVCTVDGCDRTMKSLGMCEQHRQRVKKHGDPQAHKPIRLYAGRVVPHADDALLAGHSVDMICADLDVTPASLVRAYQRAGRTVPAPIRHRHNEILTGRSSL